MKEPQYERFLKFIFEIINKSEQKNKFFFSIALDISSSVQTSDAGK